MQLASCGYMVVSLQFQDGTATYARNKAGEVIPFRAPNDGKFSDLQGMDKDMKDRFR